MLQDYHYKTYIYRIVSCDSKEDLKKPGWAKHVDGKRVTVINTREYPQEVRAIQCNWSYFEFRELLEDTLGF